MRVVCLVAGAFLALPAAAYETCYIHASEDYRFIAYADGHTVRFNGEMLGIRPCGTGFYCSYRENERGEKVPAEFYADYSTTDPALLYYHPQLGEIRLKSICPEVS